MPFRTLWQTCPRKKRLAQTRFVKVRHNGPEKYEHIPHKRLGSKLMLNKTRQPIHRLDIGNAPRQYRHGNPTAV